MTSWNSAQYQQQYAANYPPLKQQSTGGFAHCLRRSGTQIPWTGDEKFGEKAMNREVRVADARVSKPAQLGGAGEPFMGGAGEPFTRKSVAGAGIKAIKCGATTMGGAGEPFTVHNSVNDVDENKAGGAG